MYMYVTRLASNEMFSPLNKIHQKVGRAKDLSAPLYVSGKVRKNNKIYWNIRSSLLAVHSYI